MDVAGRITEWGPALTPAERRVADVVLQRPQLVAFGTVAELANEAGSGAATVVRLAGKLGYDGFTALQDAVQAELAHRLRPAAERIRQPVAPDVIGRTMATELDNVQSTLEAVDREVRPGRQRCLSAARVVVLSGRRHCGIAAGRWGAGLLRGAWSWSSAPGGRRPLHRPPRGGDACLVVDLRRYDRWVLGAAKRAGAGGHRDRPDRQRSPPSRCWPMRPSPSSPSAPDRSTRRGDPGAPQRDGRGCRRRLRSSATDRLDRIGPRGEAGALIEPSPRRRPDLR
jgi:DNA-binding MurR/RpiR family transcriptional regulator